MRYVLPSKSPPIASAMAEQLAAIGRQIRAQRKRLGVSAVSLAEAVGMSRVTVHRIEAGEPSVTMGAYLSALGGVGLGLTVALPASSAAQPIPERIRLADYPQLKQLAWHLPEADTLTPHEALDIYERHQRHLATATLTPDEQALIAALRAMPP